MKLRSHLIILVVAALLPMLIFAGVMIVVFGRQQQRFLENGLLDTARALSLAVDRELEGSISSLQVLATSEHLDSGDLRRFYKQASRILRTKEDWTNIVLFDTSGDQRINLLRPFGSALPVRALNDPAGKKAIETAQPTVTDLFLAQVPGAPRVAINIPVMRDSRVKYVLTTTISPAFLSKLLLQQKPSDEWEAGVIDKNNIIIARTRNIEEFLGKPAGPVLAAKSKESQEAVWRGVMQQGPRVYSALHRSELSGWTVVVGMHATAIDTPMRRNLVTVVGGGMALLLVGVVAATVFGRRIANSISFLSNAAAALGRSEMPQTLTSPVIEVSEVAQAIEDAAKNRHRIEEKLQRNLERTTVLHDINQAMGSTLDLRAVLNLLLEKIDLLLPYPATVVLLMNSETGELEPLACRNPDATEWGKSWQSGRGLSKIVLETQAPLVVKNMQTDPRVANPDFLRKHGLVSFLGIPLIADGAPLGLICFNTRAEHDFSKDEIDFLSTLASQIAVAIRNSRLYEQSRNLGRKLLLSRDHLRSLTRKIISSREEEAKRIARELHDEAGQLLASVFIVLDEMASTGSNDIMEKTRQARILLGQIEEQLRNLSHELRPTVLDDLGLYPAIQSLCQRFSSRTTIPVGVDFDNDGQFSPPVETALYRIVQEALTNISKHAQATAADVRIHRKDGLVHCVVRDNGAGFDVLKVLTRAGTEGVGLMGIRERVEMLKGKLEIHSDFGHGTELRVTIPSGKFK